MTRRDTYTGAGIVGAVLAGVVFLVVLFNGHLSLLQKAPAAVRVLRRAGAQPAGAALGRSARAALRGGLPGPRQGVQYFGPFPALLRLPIAAVTDGLDGRLGQISMLVAFAVTLMFTVRLAWRIRPLVRGSAPVTRGEQWAVGGFTFVVGAGSVLVFLASRSWVYHEAALWGVALALGAFEFVIAYTLVPTRRHLGVGVGAYYRGCLEPGRHRAGSAGGARAVAAGGPVASAPAAGGHG